MFGFISKNKIVKNALEIYFEEDTSKARSVKDLYYKMGNANALNGLCSRLGINLSDFVKIRK